MRVTVITACYNSASTLESSIQSVVNQSYSNIEYILIDGGSNDETSNIIKKYDGHIAQYVSEPDNGIYDALNKGLSMATGDVIGFVHSDDVLASKATISNIISEFKNTNSDGVYGDLIYIDKIKTDKIIRYWKGTKFNIKLLKKGWMPAHPSLFLKSEVYKKHGNFDLTFKIAADYDFMLRVLKDKNLKFSYLPEIITKMRVGGASNRNLTNIILKTKEDYRAIKHNNIGGLYSILFKNTSKLKQFFRKN